MSQSFLKGVIEKSLKVKKAPSVQGSVKIHFPNPKVQDIIITNYDTVEVFARVGITSEDVRASNIVTLLNRGDLVIC